MADCIGFYVHMDDVAARGVMRGADHFWMELFGLGY